MPAPDSSSWTLIPVMYRDASNFKAHGVILLEGIVTGAEIATLRASLHEETYYVPRQLGLDHLATEKWPGSFYEDDHNWHEVCLSEISTVELAMPALMRVEGTQDGGTVADFISKVQKAAADGWDPA